MTSAHHGRNVAKFLAGWAASATVGHWVLGILGTNLFPITIGRFTFTSTWNNFAMVVWPIVLAALIHAAWMREQPPEPGSKALADSAATCAEGSCI